MNFKKIILDSSTLISMASNCLLWVLKDLKTKSNVEFYIPSGVKRESIDTALNSKKWQLEGMRLTGLVKEGVLSITNSSEFEDKTNKIMELANSIFIAKGFPIKKIISGVDSEIIALAKSLNSNTIATDEKTIRLLIEDPYSLQNILSSKLHMNISLREKPLRELKRFIGEINVLRSTEISLVALEKGVFDNLIEKTNQSKRFLLSAVLWALKLHGCAISEREINEYLKLYLK